MPSPDDPNDTPLPRIRLDDVRSLEKWSKELNVTEAQLREAVAAVGDRASDVELHLKGSRSSTNEDTVGRA